VTEPLHLLDDPPRGERRVSAIAEALESVGLRADDARRWPHEFSGGPRQRIALARALIIRPELIVLDEAVSALDVSVRARVLDLLADPRARFGLAYLFISHDLAVVRAITDRVMVMRAGRIVEQGPTEEVLDAPQQDYTRALVAAAPRLEGRGNDARHRTRA
jgi:peptide/nickel transport system ATP-binding protein